MNTTRLSIFAAIFHMCVGAVAAAEINLVPQSSQVAVGGGVTLDFKVSGLSGSVGDSLSGFDINLLFDPTVLALRSYSFSDGGGTNWLSLPEAGAMSFVSDVIVSGNTIDAFGVSGNSAAALDAGQPDNFRFLSIAFEALAQGSTNVSVDLADPNLLFLDSNGAPLSMRMLNSAASITIQANGSSATPEPNGLLLVALGLATLLGSQRKFAPRQ
jgi:hypothetical protein